MGLNIKSEETHRLAKELTSLTGESLTAAVTQAIREKVNRLKHNQPVTMAARLMEIGRDCAPRLRDAEDHADLLYDQDGLPK
jgi:antitoxin VapB